MMELVSNRRPFVQDLRKRTGRQRQRSAARSFDAVPLAIVAVVVTVVVEADSVVDGDVVVVRRQLVTRLMMSILIIIVGALG